MKKLWIAEKPSLAKEIAFALAYHKGLDNKSVDRSEEMGCWRVGDEAVTWLFGHMYEQAPPITYIDEPVFREVTVKGNTVQKEQWRIEDLPIVPKKWELIAIDDKKKHLGKIRKLIKEADAYVNAGDAAREGQLLVDELLLENRVFPFSPKVERLWVQSVARADLLKAMSNLKPNSDYEPLYQSAIGRSRADWLHGMNLSRLYTLKAKRLVSVGRVQTPTLKLVVDRDAEIKNFKPTDYFQPTVRFKHVNGEFTSTWIIPEECEAVDADGRLIDKALADAVVSRVTGQTGVVSSYSVKKKTTPPPLPFSLSALQTECSAKFNMGAKQVLDIAQALYETHKLTSYPRSDSRYLPTSILKSEAPKIIEKLSNIDGFEIAGKADLEIKSAAWNDAKISDHHGIIPTVQQSQQAVAALNDDELKVYTLITNTFIAQFFPHYEYNATSVVVDVDVDQFKSSGTSPLKMGWKEVIGQSAKKEEDLIPSMKDGDDAVVVDAKCESKKTTPPPHFTEGTLIAAMSNIHRFVKDPDIKKTLKENEGIGTEATRSNMLEMLLRRNFMQRKNKGKKTFIVSTEVGQDIISVLPKATTGADMTARWERQLNQIANNEYDLDKFMKEQLIVLNKHIEHGKAANVNVKGYENKKSKVKPMKGHGEECPKCGKGQMLTVPIGKGPNKGKTFLACSEYRNDKACDHVIWPDSKPKKKPIAKKDQIEGHGECCSSCGEGTMVTRVVGKGDHKGKKFLSCDAYPKCKNSVWPK